MEKQKITLQTFTIQENKIQIGVFSILWLPKVPSYVAGYSCLKGCMYGLYLWLPTFLSTQTSIIAQQKGYISSMLDLGSVIGGLITGYLTDKFNKKALFLSPLLCVSSILMFIVSSGLMVSAWSYYLMIFLIGSSIGGPYNIIGSVIAIDIGAKMKQNGSVTKVSSLIEGIAALFTAVQMIIIPFVPFEKIFFIFSS